MLYMRKFQFKIMLISSSLFPVTMLSPLNLTGPIKKYIFSIFIIFIFLFILSLLQCDFCSHYTITNYPVNMTNDSLWHTLLPTDFTSSRLSLNWSFPNFLESSHFCLPEHYTLLIFLFPCCLLLNGLLDG